MWNIRRSLRILGCAAFSSAMIGASLVPAELLAQEHHHPAPALALHEKFYSTWFMPDEPNKSCCNKADCYPTQVKFHDGRWWAMRRGDCRYTPSPRQKLAINRSDPEGRNHLCAPPPSSYHAPDTVFCFALGGGT